MITMRSKTTVVLLTAAVLAGCGGDDAPSSGAGGMAGAEAEEVAAAARDVITDAEKSCDLLSDRALATFTNQTTVTENTRGRCKRQIAKDELPKGVKVVVIAVDGDRASVGYRTSRRVTGAMELVNSGGTWLMDGVNTVPPGQ